jgi:hypothetical protein
MEKREKIYEGKAKSSLRPTTRTLVQYFKDEGHGVDGKKGHNREKRPQQQDVLQDIEMLEKA